MIYKLRIKKELKAKAEEIYKIVNYVYVNFEYEDFVKWIEDVKENMGGK